ncbi:MAG: hypothetical protein Q4P24_13680 [Rhodobacterales bacterium]|nr:hypothetical protein [Rhodobacterales bacterium]
MPGRPRYIIAFYEIDRAFGGPEEGGWWFDTGELRRAFKVVRSEAEAVSIVSRANRLMARLQRHKRNVCSVAYEGGQYEAHMFEDSAPLYFPQTRPHYE